MAQRWVEQLLRDNRLQAVLIYGSPYLLQEFQPKLPPKIPCVFTYGQTDVAQALALQAIYREYQMSSVE